MNSTLHTYQLGKTTIQSSIHYLRRTHMYTLSKGGKDDKE